VGLAKVKSTRRVYPACVADVNGLRMAVVNRPDSPMEISPIHDEPGDCSMSPCFANMRFSYSTRMNSDSASPNKPHGCQVSDRTMLPVT